jgi:DNA-binding MarR family transcriptional regulator
MGGDMVASRASRAGAALRRLVDLVAHRSGSVVVFMNESGVTLPQVLLMSRIERVGSASLLELSEDFSASAAALSQMIERLVQQGWVRRAEDPSDRRRKTVQLTSGALALLRKLKAARSSDYEIGLSPLSKERLVEFAAMLESVVAELDGSLPKSFSVVAGEKGGVAYGRK